MNTQLSYGQKTLNIQLWPTKHISVDLKLCLRPQGHLQDHYRQKYHIAPNVMVLLGENELRFWAFLSPRQPQNIHKVPSEILMVHFSGIEVSPDL
jgi:hypothetical protein